MWMAEKSFLLPSSSSSDTFVAFCNDFAREYAGIVSRVAPLMMLPSNSRDIDSSGTPLVSGTLFRN